MTLSNENCWVQEGITDTLAFNHDLLLMDEMQLRKFAINGFTENIDYSFLAHQYWLDLSLGDRPLIENVANRLAHVYVQSGIPDSVYIPRFDKDDEIKGLFRARLLSVLYRFSGELLEDGNVEPEYFDIAKGVGYTVKKIINDSISYNQMSADSLEQSEESSLFSILRDVVSNPRYSQIDQFKILGKYLT